MKENEILERLDEAEMLGYGEEQVRRFEEIIAAADSYQNETLQFDARMLLVEGGIFSGFIEKAIVAFSWCLATFDRNPEKFASYEDTILWAYKWIGQNMIAFASINRERLQKSLDDFERRYTEKGISLRPVYSQHVRNRIDLGESREEIQQALNSFIQAPRDYYSDCSACEQNFLVEIALNQNDLDKAARYAAPIFAGSKVCAEVPHITYAIMTLPTLNSGNRKDAETYAREAERLCLENRDFLFELSEVISYHVAVKQFDDALRIFNHIYRWELETQIDSRKKQFSTAAGLLFEQLPGQSFTLSFPINHEIYQDSGSYEAEVLVNYYTNKADSLAKRFDSRNGNEHISDLLRERRTTIRRYVSE